MPLVKNCVSIGFRIWNKYHDTTSVVVGIYYSGTGKASFGHNAIQNGIARTCEDDTCKCESTCVFTVSPTSIERLADIGTVDKYCEVTLRYDSSFMSDYEQRHMFHVEQTRKTPWRKPKRGRPKKKKTPVRPKVYWTAKKRAKWPEMYARHLAKKEKAKKD